MDAFASVIATVWPGVQLSVFTVALMTAVELATSRERQSLAGRLPGLLFWASWSPVTLLALSGFHALWDKLGLRPLIVLPLRLDWTGAAAVVLAPLLAAMIGDFFFYWCHRFQHHFLWRYHAVHHAIEELNSVNAFHHVTEPIVQTLLITLPASLILSDSGALLPGMALLLHLHAAYIHSPTRFHFGPLRALFVDNRFHRIHHSVEQRHFDKNFAAITPLWDRVFGTAHFPTRDEWPDTGIAECGQPRSVRAWLDLPWRYARATATRDPAPVVAEHDRAAAAR